MPQPEFKLVEHVATSPVNPLENFTVYIPNPHDEEEFIDRFYYAPYSQKSTTLLELDGIGERDISTRVLRHWAVYLAFKGIGSSVLRNSSPDIDPLINEHECHDFVRTFMLGMFACLHTCDVDHSRMLKASKNPPRLNDVISLPVKKEFSPDLRVGHSQIVASRHSKDNGQFSVSKFGAKGSIALYDWEQLYKCYPFLSPNLYFRIKDARFTD